MLKQRKPMPRGKGFRKPPATPWGAPETEATFGLVADGSEIEQRSATPARPLHRGTYASLSAVVAAPKHPRAENPHLLRMAKGKPCLIRSPLCNFDVETTVACHGGGVENGKGMAYKVSDALTCWGCSACNYFTDAYGGASNAEKREAFQAGHVAQVCEWRAIAGSATADPKDRAAAQWALDQLATSASDSLE